MIDPADCLYADARSRLRRLVLSDCFFFVTVKLLPKRRPPAGLLKRPEEWRWSIYHEYPGVGAVDQEKRCGFVVDRARLARR